MKRKNKSSIVEILQTLTLGQLETKKNHTFFFLFFLFLQYSGGTSKMFNFVGCSMNAMQFEEIILDFTLKEKNWHLFTFQLVSFWTRSDQTYLVLQMINLSGSRFTIISWSPWRSQYILVFIFIFIYFLFFYWGDFLIRLYYTFLPPIVRTRNQEFSSGFKSLKKEWID